MCGIAGVYALEGELPPAVLDALSRVPPALRHRGPDAAGTWVAPDRRTALAATRLAIRDLRRVADQPFVSERGATVYNGELYEWPDHSIDVKRRTLGDTEIIHQLTCTDPVSLTQVSGMYAVATWRAASRSLVLARDPAGEKPLYVVRNRRWLAFASELHALVVTGLLAPEIDRDAVAMLLRLGHVPEPFCIYRGVQLLSAGSIFEVDPNGNEATHTWWPQPTVDQGPIRTDVVRGAIIDAVGKSTVSDVPSGIFLSGGVDSSIVAASARAAGCDLTAFTVTASRGSDDESADASATARHLRMHHEVVTVTADQARSHLPAFFSAMDQPTVDGFNSYLVCKAARSAGLIVALSGVGGDELFRGYKTFSNMQRAEWLRRVPGREALFSLGAKADRFRGQRITDVLRARNEREAYVAVRGVLGMQRTERLLGGPIDWAGILSRLDLDTTGTKGDQATSLLEARGYMRNQLLRDLDVFAMACSLEVRAPLLSPKIIALAGAMPNRKSLRGKRILKDAFRADLPAGLFDRPKRSFSLPWDSWLRTTLRGTTLEALQDLPRAQSFIDPTQTVGLLTDFEAGHLHWSGVWVVAALYQWKAAHQSDIPPGFKVVE